jgi:two-component system OmpR family sensor kinase/two-component system sensor histidine kinase BaeS
MAWDTNSPMNNSKRRPEWWPQNEAWTPERWQKQRGFFWRGILVFALLFALVFGVCTLIFWSSIWYFSTADREFSQLPRPEFPPVFQPRGRLPFFPFTCGWLIVAFVGVSILIRIARRMLAPMNDLMRAASRVEQGDYSARVEIRGPRDVRDATRAFNAMVTRLQHNENQRRRLMADVTHELRTPLTVIQGNLEGVIDGIYPADESHLQPILEETRVMSRLIEDLRTLSLAEAGTLKLQKEHVALDELIEDVVVSFCGQATIAGVSLQTQIDNPLPQLDLDPTRIREVLSNLIANALRYTPSGGAISIKAKRGEGDVRVAVIDTGKGIVAEDLPHVFDRFYKSADSRGTGLGLAIAKSLIEAHGGEMSATSEIGKGATISFSLPYERP